jgi:hypothetical protein
MMSKAFVILQHSGWGEEHFDLLLERGAGLEAWQVAAGGAAPWDLAVGERLPARPLAEHRRVYLTYEGDVSGGRGTVIRVDEGQWQETARGGEGVELSLEGKRCWGRYAIRKTADAKWEFALLDRGRSRDSRPA